MKAKKTKKKSGLVIIVKDYGRLHQASFKYSELTDYAKRFRKEYEHIAIEIPKDKDHEFAIINRAKAFSCDINPANRR